ncbi:DUF819 family protein [Crocinitomix catalasitica]|uniref:DUF819 family protein n=1 Tax=Crocinitomix catalasitica TaxID=184607 RepID=UPI000A867F6D|nr:DUF819 family protein [Crocinitomix catalasitica]
MKYLFLLFSFSCLLIGTATPTIQYATDADHDSLFTTINFDDLNSLYYLSQTEDFKIYFENYDNYQIYLDGDTTEFYTNSPILVTNLKRGDHTLTLYKKEATCAVPTEVNKSFKLKKDLPLITNDAVVFGLLMFVLFLVFKTAASQRTFFVRFYRIVPALLLCYFIPAGLNSLGIVSSEESDLYFIASRYLLPASLVLLCLSIDIPAIKKLGSKAIIMFFAATIGIVVGGPIALWTVSLIAPEVLDDNIWRGLSTVAGSWIGGGANQTAMKEIYSAPDQLFSAMIVVDVFVANIFMSILLFGTGMNKKINRFFKADDSAIEALTKKMENFQASIAKVPTFNDLVKMMGITFFAVGMAHFLSDIIAPIVSGGLESMKTPFDPCLGIPFSEVQTGSDIAADLMVSFGSGFFWLVVFSTIFGVVLSFTKFRNLEGVGASKMGSLFLYVLVATIGMKMDIFELIANWGVFKFLLSIGLIWILIHAIFLFVVAKIIKAPFFYVAVGSQANIGGAASAPIVASAFSPSLAPVGVLLAVLGYAVGTFGAIICTILMQALSVG